MAWYTQLNQALFRTLPFGVFSGKSSFGRRQALHEYPFRDKPWPEDMGRKTREFQLVGFILENDVVTKTGDVIALRDNFIAAAEKNDTGTLVHPTLGALQVSMLNLEIEEAFDHGRMFRLLMTFIEAGERKFAEATISTTDQVQTVVSKSFTASAFDFVVKMKSLYNQGAAVVEQVKATADFWIRQGQTLVDDATNIYNFVVGLPQEVQGEFGRFFGGRTLGGFGVPILNANNPSVTVDQLIAQGSIYRKKAGLSFTALGTSAASNDAQKIADDAQALAQAVLSSCLNPSDGIRALTGLAVFTPPSYTTTAPIGVAINSAATAAGDLFRRAAVAVLAKAASTYQPASYDDAVYIRTLVCNAIDAEVQIAGDQGEDDTFIALRSLLAAVSLDLTTRGGSLAPIGVFQSNRSIPAPVWALRLYRDLGRSDQLVTQVNPMHPAFMPLSFKALSE